MTRFFLEVHTFYFSLPPGREEKKRKKQTNCPFMDSLCFFHEPIYLALAGCDHYSPFVFGVVSPSAHPTEVKLLFILTAWQRGKDLKPTTSLNNVS